MARKPPANLPTDEYESTEEFDVSSLPEGVEFEWQNVVERSAIVMQFDKIGDTFIGQYDGVEHIEPENGADDGSDNFDRYVFLRDGNRFAVNMSYKVAKALDGVEKGTWVRIKYVANVPTKRGLNDMKDFVVDVSRK